MIKRMPSECPACDGTLKVKCLKCTTCETQIEGLFDLPAYLQLSTEEQTFILHFVLNSGSLKQMAEKMKLSYPTVRNVLDAIIEKLNTK